MRNWRKHLDDQLTHPVRAGSKMKVVVDEQCLNWIERHQYQKDGYEFTTTTPESTIKTVESFWSKPAKGVTKSFLAPELKYRSFLVNALLQEIGPYKAFKIWELGCGAGRNLRYLKSKGFTSLHGLDICKEAIDLLQKDCPSIYSVCKPVEEWGDWSEVTIGFAFFEHIHPEKWWVFDKIADKSQYIISVANEVDLGCAHFPRKFKKVFEDLGKKQIFEMNCDHVEPGFVARIFRS